MIDNNTPIYSLQELNAAIRNGIERSLPDRYWVCAEISELHINTSGHCYLELIEKESRGHTIARSRAIIWSNIFLLLKLHFEQETHQTLSAGIKILVQVSVTFHEVYGISLTIHDINPTYTLGEAARLRAEILAKLNDEGVANMNKELPLPLLPQRIAIISSKTAAGYGDFIDQLANNPYGYTFYPVLFTATMQGKETETSIIAALNRIYRHIDHFDCVVIIRGGGSTADLASFDSYTLAANVAQFPLPIIVGIGHDRDETILDIIAAIRVKTPTAAAEWLINRIDETAIATESVRRKITEIVEERLHKEKIRIQQLTSTIPYTITQRINGEVRRQQNITNHINLYATEHIRKEHTRLTLITERLPQCIASLIQQEQYRIEQLSQSIKLLSPDSILSRGYSLVLQNNKVIKSVDMLHPGTTIEILLADGTAQATITETHKNNIK